MRPVIALALLALAVSGGFFIGVLKLLNDDIGIDW